MSQDRGEVKVGSVGTVYRAPIFDDDLEKVNFDPTGAGTKLLIFFMPGATGPCVRDAVAAQVEINQVLTWCLVYTVLADDVQPYVDESTGGFHQEAGPIRVEPFLEVSPNQRWPGGTVDTDYQGRDLKVIERASV